MKKYTISDFSGGMVERISPDDYKPGEVGRMYGFVPEDDQSIRTQWPIQSIGSGSSEDTGWGSSDNIYHLTAVYPIRGYNGVYLIATKEDGSIWWAKAPSGQDTFDVGTDNSKCLWNELTGTNATNQGFKATASYTAQPYPIIEKNPDYRFICELPFEIYKYIRTAVKDNVSDFQRDEVPDSVPSTDSSDEGVEGNPPRSIVSGVLLHSRRYYDDGSMTRSVDINSKVTLTDGEATTTVTTITTDTAHGYSVGDTVKINSSNSAFNGSYYITAETTYTFSFSKTRDAGISSTTIAGTAYTVSRTQTSVICYIDPTVYDSITHSYGVVKAVTFPNIRRWPVSTTDSTPGYDSTYTPMESWLVKSDKTQAGYKFIAEYPYPSGSIVSTTSTSAYPKDTNIFHPYTYLDTNKVMHPGTGIIPRGNIGTIWGAHLIIGDIEWREDASHAVLSNKKIIPTANHAAMGSQYSPFGLRDGNTEPHRGYFWYSEEEVDKFDPRSVIRVSGTDTRIAGMHTVNNRLVAITTSGGKNDGVIAFAGSLSALHPYTPGVQPNLSAIRKEVIRGGVGTADSVDSYNHGNPQTCLWPEFGMIAFIDKTGYVFVTDGTSCNLLDERLPIKGSPVASTVNDHVASVGKHLFILKDGFLFCYTLINGKGAWSILKRPEAFWRCKPDDGYFKQYNVIKSMRGIGNELYFVVHSYYQNVDENYQPISGQEPILSKSRVMRYAINGPISERGCQDGQQLDGLEIQTPAIGVSSQSTKTNWNMVGINFYSEAGCTINGVKVSSTSPGISGTQVSYSKGYTEDTDPTLDSSYNPIYDTDLGVYTEGFHAYEMPAGIGPQHVLSAKFNFRGDVKIEGINIWFTGTQDIKGGL